MVVSREHSVSGLWLPPARWFQRKPILLWHRLPTNEDKGNKEPHKLKVVRECEALPEDRPFE